MANENFERRQQTRGRPYTLAEFQSKYELVTEQAADLYRRFGPSSVDLDLIMAAKARKVAFPERLA